MKSITRKGLNFIQKIGATPILLKIVHLPAVNSFFSFWEKRSLDDYRREYLLLKKYLDKAGLSLSGLSVLEVGSGGSVGMGYFFVAAGCKSWLATDLYSNLLTDANWIRNEKKIVGEISKKYWSEVKSFIKFNGDKIKIKPPFKFRKLDITHFNKSFENTFDVVISQAVFEHIDRKKLPAAIKNLSRYIKKGGIMIHEIDLRDHINVICPLNFYRYGEDRWNKLTRGTIFYTNRLRASDYKKEFMINDLQEIFCRSEVEKKALAPAPAISKDFQRYSKADLATTKLFTILIKH
ncbi:MAG: class I SAM-dependent methyltransferase [Candidatus Berkelbacteria bacterium]|nr:class I SAM-dependent methyltransferase [Candidatus Berkelbacteria bacterium]